MPSGGQEKRSPPLHAGKGRRRVLLFTEADFFTLDEISLHKRKRAKDSADAGEICCLVATRTLAGGLTYPNT